MFGATPKPRPTVLNPLLTTTPVIACFFNKDHGKISHHSENKAHLHATVEAPYHKHIEKIDPTDLHEESLTKLAHMMIIQKK